MKNDTKKHVASIGIDLGDRMSTYCVLDGGKEIMEHGEIPTAAEAFRDEFGGHDFSDAARQRWLDDPLMEPELLTVAFDGHEVVAAVQGAIDPDENEANGYLCGWTDPVFTRRAWRRRGLAYALLGRSLQRLRERGMTSAQLGVDSQNENRAFTLYERHRYAVDRSASEWHKPLGLDG